ncbi:putative transporter SCO4007 [Microbacterium oxydans]|uniref:MFS transporter n=1 Tax=Microbacterium oxydans TaxID=82380 RepID=UPI001DD00BD2|nr:MFS transporter [Microbacterium oxydans]CAH0231442.1 putative transporter SCO4007 [Microbacterium oxydans]
MSVPLGRRMLLATVCAVAVGSIYAAQPVLEQMGRDLALPSSHWGWIVAAGQLGYLVGLVALVPLGDLMDRRRLIAAHLVLAAVGVAIAATATAAWVLFLGLAGAGVFAVVVQTAVAYTASSSAPEERGRNLGLVTSGVVLGILGSRVAAGALADAWGWRSIYLVLALLLLLLAFLALRLLPSDRRVERTTYRRVLGSLGGLFRERLFLSRGLIAFFLFASFGTLWSGLALPLSEAPWHLDPAQIGLFGLAGLVGAAGAARAGRWADSGRSSLVTGGALVLLIGSWVATGQAMWSLWLLIVGVIVLDFAVQAVHVSNQHALTTAHPDRTSSVIGGYMAFYSLGSALGATATSSVFAIAGWTGSSILGAAFALCALIVWAVDHRGASVLRRISRR